jgi:hypothetical protein
MRAPVAWQLKLSERLVPVWLGALALASIAALRALLFLIIAIFGGDWTEFGRALLAVVFAGVGGAAGGVAYVVLGVPLRLIPRMGHFLAGIVTVSAYLAVVLTLIRVIDPTNGLSFRDPDSRLAFVICSVIFGIVVGHHWFSPTRSSSD